jgi:acyl-CoA thioesterase I
MSEQLPPCNVPREIRSLGRGLPKFAEALQQQGKVTIVAIGSSSTEGDGASSAGASYPSRLSTALSVRFPQPSISVLNLGVGGQEAPDEAARFKNDVLGRSPSLVVWQVGTNAAWKDYFLDDVQAAIFRGLGRLTASAADVIIMNPQYAPALLAVKTKIATERMLELIAAAAEESNVAVFDRFEIMKYWNTVAQVPFDQMISNFDGNMLHQNDWSYNCIAEALADAIVEAVAVDAPQFRG